MEKEIKVMPKEITEGSSFELLMDFTKIIPHAFPEGIWNEILEEPVE